VGIQTNGVENVGRANSATDNVQNYGIAGGNIWVVDSCLAGSTDSWANKTC
jgi:hypothetical protein